MADKILATVEPGVWQELLGYLNFSSGSPDCRFLRNLNELVGRIEAAGTPPGESAAVLHRRLGGEAGRVGRPGSPVFADAEQARAVLRLVFQAVLPAYRGIIAICCFICPDGELLRPLFIGRVVRGGAGGGAVLGRNAADRCRGACAAERFSRPPARRRV